MPRCVWSTRESAYNPPPCELPRWFRSCVVPPELHSGCTFFSKSSRLKVMSASVLETVSLHPLARDWTCGSLELHERNRNTQMENHLNMLWYQIKNRSALDDFAWSRNIILVVWSGHQVVDITKKTLAPLSSFDHVKNDCLNTGCILIIGPFMIKGMTCLHVCFVLFILQ